jgi:DNA-directed RNA polymerase sigma subunit (sigma70/sigma32)
MAMVTPDERVILATRFGLDRGEYRTLAETAALVGRSADEVRVVEERAVSEFCDRFRHAAVSPTIPPPGQEPPGAEGRQPA